MKQNNKKIDTKSNNWRYVRPTVELGVFLLGVITIILSRVLFGVSPVRTPYANEVAADDFGLFFKLSLIISVVLLILTVLSSLTYMFQKNVNRFQKLTVSLAPAICSLTMFVLSVFYAYLTSGSVVNITGYLLMLGVGEAMLFRLPCAVYVLLRTLKK